MAQRNNEIHLGDDLSGFDAAFFLHHANVDRLLSLWQALNQDVWVTPGDQPQGTYTIKDDGPVDVKSGGLLDSSYIVKPFIDTFIHRPHPILAYADILLELHGGQGLGGILTLLLSRVRWPEGKEPAGD